ncbi:unnamed protein product [Amoebophrya sp. A120]|nr:unnamed protein product [Amoebophrya sp. A120]|eukprot:GSA120T00019352001.1
MDGGNNPSATTPTSSHLRPQTRENKSNSPLKNAISPTFRLHGRHITSPAGQGGATGGASSSRPGSSAAGHGGLLHGGSHHGTTTGVSGVEGLLGTTGGFAGSSSSSSSTIGVAGTTSGSNWKRSGTGKLAQKDKSAGFANANGSSINEQVPTMSLLQRPSSSSSGSASSASSLNHGSSGFPIHSSSSGNPSKKSSSSSSAHQNNNNAHAIQNSNNTFPKSGLEDERFHFLLHHGVVRAVEGQDRIIFAELPNLPLIVYRSPAEREYSPERFNLDRRKLQVCPLLEGEEKLRLLNYQKNSIQKIENLVSLPNLIFLDLYGNQIETIENLQTVPTLKVLMLGKNKIKKGVEHLALLPKLDVVDLHANSLKEMPFAEPAPLRVLNLASNLFEQQFNLPHLLENLIELNLRRNKIEHLGRLDITCFNLQRLYVSHNQLKSLNSIACVAKMTKLVDLSVDNNPLVDEKNREEIRREIVLKCSETLKTLDEKLVSEEEKKMKEATAKAAPQGSWMGEKYESAALDIEQRRKDLDQTYWSSAGRRRRPVSGKSGSLTNAAQTESDLLLQDLMSPTKMDRSRSGSGNLLGSGTGAVAGEQQAPSEQHQTKKPFDPGAAPDHPQASSSAAASSSSSRSSSNQVPRSTIDPRDILARVDFATAATNTVSEQAATSVTSPEGGGAGRREREGEQASSDLGGGAGTNLQQPLFTTSTGSSKLKDQSNLLLTPPLTGADEQAKAPSVFDEVKNTSKSTIEPVATAGEQTTEEALTTDQEQGRNASATVTDQEIEPAISSANKPFAAPAQLAMKPPSVKVQPVMPEVDSSGKLTKPPSKVIDLSEPEVQQLAEEVDSSSVQAEETDETGGTSSDQGTETQEENALQLQKPPSTVVLSGVQVVGGTTATQNADQHVGATADQSQFITPGTMVDQILSKHIQKHQKPAEATPGSVPGSGPPASSAGGAAASSSSAGAAPAPPQPGPRQVLTKEGVSTSNIVSKNIARPPARESSDQLPKNKIAVPTSSVTVGGGGLPLENPPSATTPATSTHQHPSTPATGGTSTTKRGKKQAPSRHDVLNDIRQQWLDATREGKNPQTRYGYVKREEAFELFIYGRGLDAMDKHEYQAVVSSIQFLFLSINSVLKCMDKLRTRFGQLDALSFSRNQILSLDQLRPLKSLNLRSLSIFHNPINETMSASVLRMQILHMLPTLQKFNLRTVTESEQREVQRVYSGIVLPTTSSSTTSSGTSGGGFATGSGTGGSNRGANKLDTKENALKISPELQELLSNSVKADLMLRKLDSCFEGTMKDLVADAWDEAMELG